MKLKNALNAGLRLISNFKHDQKYQLDKNDRCSIHVPFPPSVSKLKDNCLKIEVVLSPTHDYFSLFTPMAILSRNVSQKVLLKFLEQHLHIETVSALTYSLETKSTCLTLYATYHWMLGTITPEDFRSLFKKFVGSVFDLIEEIKVIQSHFKYIKVLHQGRSC